MLCSLITLGTQSLGCCFPFCHMLIDGFVRGKKKILWEDETFIPKLV